ncbi:hypothetical protein Tco_0755787 [Tanacetum coccineum]
MMFPPHLRGLFAPPIIDLSHTGIEKFKEPEVVGYGVKVDKCVSETSPIVVEKKTVVPIIPKVDIVRPKQQENQVHQLGSDFVMIKKACYICGSFEHLQYTFLMKSGTRPVNATKPKAAYNAVKRNRFNAVKALACWVWMPKNRVMDAQAQGRQECSKEKEESREECSKSRKTKKMKCLEESLRKKNEEWFYWFKITAIGKKVNAAESLLVVSTKVNAD